MIIINNLINNSKHHLTEIIFFWVSEWVKSLSRVRLFATPWTVAYQASPSLGFSRQEYWSGLSCPPPGDLPHPGIKSSSPASSELQVDYLPADPSGKPKGTRQDHDCYLKSESPSFLLYYQVHFLFPFCDNSPLPQWFFFYLNPHPQSLGH